jgi:hypothetical protein
MEKKIYILYIFFLITVQFDDFPRYARYYGGFVSIDEDKFSCGNQEQDVNGSFRKRNETCDFKKYVNPGSRQYEPPGNCPISY